MNQRHMVYCALVLITLSLPAYSIKNLEDIKVGGTYHMILTTGDELEGVVETKTDSSLILESNGTPYTFVCNLIVEYKLLSAPPAAAPQASLASGSKEYTFDELRQQMPLGANLDVRITGGTTFQGTLISIDNEYVKLNVNGSVIPLAKSVVNRIMTTTASKPDSSAGAVSDAQAPKTAPEVLDTLIVKNKDTDEYGKPKEPIVLIGKITQETNSAVSFTTKDNASSTYPFSQIVQLFRHSQENSETELIRRYAQALICPPTMILVDIPPGKAGRPFLKVCIDKYEFPNKEGVVPQVNIGYAQAQALCQQQGKRLCSAQEWQWACSGLEGYTYSYGWNFDKEACNTDGRFPDPSGKHSHCIGKFGAMDMVGNVFEWVKGGDDKPAAMGGPLSKCQTLSPGSNGDPKPQTGFRCCKSN